MDILQHRDSGSSIDCICGSDLQVEEEVKNFAHYSDIWRRWKLGIKHVSLVSIVAVLVIVIALTAIYFYPAEKGEYNPDGWRMAYGNAQGNGIGYYNTSHIEGKILWEKELGEGINGLVVNDKNMLYAITKGKMVCLDSKGKSLWELNMNFSSVTPAIDEYGNIYAAMNGSVVSLKENGHIRWEYKLSVSKEVATAPIIVQDKRVYIMANSGNFYVLDDQGKLVTRVNLGQKTNLPPVISPKGDIYVGINSSVHKDSTLYKISPHGYIEWNITLAGKLFRLAFYGDNLYATTFKITRSTYPPMINITPYLFSISQDGKIDWKIDLNTFWVNAGAPIALAVDKFIYVGITPTAFPSGGGDNNTYNASFILKLDKHGNLIWKRGFHQTLQGLAVSKDGYIYATFSKYYVMSSSERLKIVALNSQGSALWQVGLNRTWTYISAPVIGPDTIYVYACYYYYPSYGINYVYAIG